MFAAWGRRVYHLRWSMLVVSGMLLTISIAFLVRGGTLTTGSIPGIEAERARSLVERELAQPGGSSCTIIFHSTRLAVTDPAFRAAMFEALAPVRSDPHVASVRTPFDSEDEIATALVGRDNHRALALVGFRDTINGADLAYRALKPRLHSTQLDLTFTGNLAFRADMVRILEADLQRAELVSMPLALIVLLLVFGTLVAAALPLGVGGLAVIGGVGGVMLLSHFLDIAQYALNIVTLIGLGVAIDYSLFIVNRYREELDRGQSVEDAVATAMGTAGRAVAFSGFAVMIGLSGLLFYRGSYLSGMGLSGALVVTLAVLYALTFLPAILAILGHRINSGRIPVRFAASSGFWQAIASWVMRRPVMVLLPTLALMVVVGLPFLKLRMAAADISALPAAAEARRGFEVLRDQFPDQVTTRIIVVARFPNGPVISPARVGALYDLSRRVAQIPHVERVESIVDLDPTLGRRDYQTVLITPPMLFMGVMQIVMHETVGSHIAVLAAVTESEPNSDEARAIVRAIRTQRHVADGDLLVTGQTALDVDSTEYILSHTPAAVIYVMAMMFVVLFLLLGSVILPLKAVLMNLLSITGSFGALVWIFQEGHLSHLLGFHPGPVEPSLPVVLFCAVFGLSMDYEVLLLSRMQEEYERNGDNTRAVAEGLERSGRLITSAAAIMVAVFAAFALADVVVVKAVGLGMAIAVTLDATVVRILIVPSTMRLFGDLNWWAPAPLARLYERIGIRDVH